MIVLWLVVLLVVALVVGAAASDLYWRRKGFRTEIRGHGRSKTKVRVRTDPEAQLPADPGLIDQDWVRMRDLDDPDEP